MTEPTARAPVREISLHLLDLLENARNAGAQRVSVEVVEDGAAGLLELLVDDDGRGLPAGRSETVFDPFYTTRTTRRVGLGLPLLRAAAERAGGRAEVTSAPGRTTVKASFGLEHVDRAPMGDIVGTLVAFMLMEGAPRLTYRYAASGDEFEFDSALAEEAAGGELTATDVSGWVRDYLAAGMGALRRSIS
ncbi:MAG: sensor histidine kinase [Anaerolineae bacterium]|nr:sensor histidine kinase [Anaerolineae bacterium]